jgi:hypothetical protein
MYRLYFVPSKLKDGIFMSSALLPVTVKGVRFYYIRQFSPIQKLQITIVRLRRPSVKKGPQIKPLN